MRLRYLGMAAAFLLAAPATALAQYPHTVTAGESLTSVAATDGLTVEQLAAENGISPTSELIQGSTLLIPPQSYSPADTEPAATEPASAPVTSVTTSGDDGTPATSYSAGYVVQPGDTLSAIAARAGITVAQLAAANDLNPNGLLLSGSSLTVPGEVTSSTQDVSTTSTGGGGPYPTPVTLSAGTVGTVATQAGTSPSLTQAVGWEESGFNNDLTSSTGAVGVMQIEPATWSYINQVLTPSAPLDPYSATDNVKAGALYLQSLINQTGSYSLAVAAYNEGLAALQSNGVYSDTQQYVNNVMSLQAQFGGG